MSKSRTPLFYLVFVCGVALLGCGKDSEDFISGQPKVATGQFRVANLSPQTLQVKLPSQIRAVEVESMHSSTFTRSRPGSYSVTAEAPGRKPVVAQVTVVEDHPTTLVFWQESGTIQSQIVAQPSYAAGSQIQIGAFALGTAKVDKISFTDGKSTKDAPLGEFETIDFVPKFALVGGPKGKTTRVPVECEKGGSYSLFAVVSGRSVIAGCFRNDNKLVGVGDAGSQ